MPDNLSLGTSTNVSRNIDISGGGTSVTLPQATPPSGTNKAGLMSADDKAKVDNSIQQGGNVFGADMLIGTDDSKIIRIKTQGADRMFVQNSYIGFYKPLRNNVTQDNSMLNLSTTGTVISRNVADSNPALIVNQQHSSSSGNTLTLQKAGIDQLSMSSSGVLKVANLAGTGTRMVTADSSGTLDATTGLTVDVSGNVVISNNIEVSGSITGIPGMGPLSLLDAAGISLTTASFGAFLGTYSLTANQTFAFPDAGGTLSVIGTTAPSSASDTGALGEIRVTSTYVYFCIATDTWVRAPFTTW